MMIISTNLDYPQTTSGISRDLQASLKAGFEARNGVADPQGGGDLNGTTATIFFHQAGTSGFQWQVPRLPAGSSNYTGTV